MAEWIFSLCSQTNNLRIYTCFTYFSQHEIQSLHDHYRPHPASQEAKVMMADSTSEELQEIHAGIYFQINMPWGKLNTSGCISLTQVLDNWKTLSKQSTT